MYKFTASLLTAAGLALVGTAPAFAQSSQAAWRFEEIVALDHAVRIVRSNPQIVVVTVRNTDGCKSPATIIRSKEADIQNVNRVDVLRIGVDTRVVPGALT